MKLADSVEGGTLRFIPPGESIEVGLEIAPLGSPLAAMREWLLRHKAKTLSSPEGIDVRKVVAPWNLGTDPHLKEAGCGSLHLEWGLLVTWDRDIYRAIKVWEKAHCGGPYPPDVLACLDPDQRLPFLGGPDPIPAEKRRVYVPIDLARPLQEQFEEALRQCDEIRNYTFLLARQPVPRPGRSEDRRNVLVYTLHKSGRMKIREIAKDLFPNEDQDRAQQKVKEILGQVNRAVERGGFKPTPLKPPPPK